MGRELLTVYYSVNKFSNHHSLPQLEFDAYGESQWGEVGGGFLSLKVFSTLIFVILVKKRF